VADVALTAPERLVGFVQHVASERDVAGIFLATNCGAAADLAFVRENLGVVTYSPPPRAADADGDAGEEALALARAAVVEQIIMARAGFVVVPPLPPPQPQSHPAVPRGSTRSRTPVTSRAAKKHSESGGCGRRKASLARVGQVPPGVGNPPEVRDTSNFALFVLEQRRVWRARAAAAAGADAAWDGSLGAEGDGWALCCGAAPALALWSPAGRAVVQAGVPFSLEVWAAFVPLGTAVSLLLTRHDAADGAGAGAADESEGTLLPVAAPGVVTLTFPPGVAGAYSASLRLVDTALGSVSKDYGSVRPRSPPQAINCLGV
jgi:hypothetical protein